LFVRLFNHAGVCWLDGHVKVSLRDDRGSWRDFTYRLAKGPTTNGPDWTGSFDPALVGVVVFGEASPVDATPTPYHGLRLALPNGGGILQFDSAEISLTSDVLTVHPIEADSQDG
jgi:prepilin-type processing-associated H-X9-DG protein